MGEVWRRDQSPLYSHRVQSRLKPGEPSQHADTILLSHKQSSERSEPTQGSLDQIWSPVSIPQSVGPPIQAPVIPTEQHQKAVPTTIQASPGLIAGIRLVSDYPSRSCTRQSPCSFGPRTLSRILSKSGISAGKAESVRRPGNTHRPTPVAGHFASLYIGSSDRSPLFLPG